MIKNILNITEKKKIAEDVLSDLPEWFGIKKSTKLTFKKVV